MRQLLGCRTDCHTALSSYSGNDRLGNTDCRHDGHQGGPSAGNKQQRYPGQRNQAAHSADIQCKVNENIHGGSYQYDLIALTLRVKGIIEQPLQNDHIAKHNDHKSENPQLLNDDRQDKVIVRLCQITVFLNGLSQSDSRKAAAGKALQTVD